MSVRRVMGTEVEYGISVPGQPTANPMVPRRRSSTPTRAATGRARRARWDFEEESPLRDARGFDLSAPGRRRAASSPTRTLGLANVILTNGARLYVDHAHPEYSTPECTNPLDIVRWDKAEQVMLDAARRASAMPGGGADPAVQEQHRQQGRVLRRPRELPDAPLHAVRRHRAAPHAVLRHPPGRLRRRPGRHRSGRARRRLPDQPAGRLLRGRGRAWRPRSSGRSSTPATSRTPTPTSTAGCT